MNLQPEACYRAVASRDARFDGRFFTAVRSTGIYCRPVCPARTPHRKNCSFYTCAAAAEEAGFRPCLRCRPETSPGSPAWQGTVATVSRALRLIGEGALDHAGVEDLAERLGMGERHLRRLFIEHLGASPIAVAQTRRVQLAKRLLDETPISMTQVAEAAGFGSVRRFNAAMKRVYDRSPLQLRRSNGDERRAATGSLSLRLSYRLPYDWEAIAGFFALRAIPGVEEVDGDAYRRTIVVGEGAGVISVRRLPGDHALALEVPIELAGHLAQIAERVRWMFDCNAEPGRISKLLRRDPVLERSTRAHPGLRLPGAWDGFELVIRAILGQQVTVSGATTLSGRLVERYGKRFGGKNEEGPAWLFPTPKALARVDPTQLSMPEARGRTIAAVAREVRDGNLVLDGSADPDEVTARLLAVPGIGDWTAQYVAMRALGASDAFPASDLGVRKALRTGEKLPGVAAVKARAEAWRPWRGYAAMHLWLEG